MNKDNMQKPAHLRDMNKKEKREAFRQFFIKAKRKLNLSSSLEDVIWMHLESTGMDSPENFKKGMQNFGYKEIK